MSDDIKSSILGFIHSNKIVNERGDRIEFDEHNFLIEPFANWHPKQVCMKSAQVGWSTLSILKVLYGATFRGYNCIYTLPTFDDVKDFVPAKIDKMIESNECLQEMIGSTDGMTKKQIGDRYIFFRGTHSTKAAIAHTSDLNVYDEYDASDINVVDMYASRLQKSKYKGEWTFSNPIRPGGIDKKYKESDQRRWMIKCSRCNHWQSLDYFLNVDEKEKKYVCSKCHQELSEEDRLSGTWVAAYTDRDVHGYHINQLMCSWVTAKDLVYLKQNKTPQMFYNMVLGLPYVEKDDVLDPRQMEACIRQTPNTRMRNAIGVDVGARTLHYVLGNHEGIFKVGTLDGPDPWGDFERICKEYNPVAVIDSGPDPHPRREYIEKQRLSNPVYIAYYKRDPLRKFLYEWADGKRRGWVFTNRSQAIQEALNSFMTGYQKITTHLTPDQAIRTDYKEFLKHWLNIYRVTEINPRTGIDEQKWKNQGEDHFVHATVYFQMALSRVPKVQRASLEDYQALKEAGYAIESHEILDGTMPASKIPMLAEEQPQADDFMYL